MNYAWESERFPDRQRHQSPRRRWSAALKQRIDYSCELPPGILIETAKQKPKSRIKLTKKDIADTKNALQLQAENFFRHLQIQSLQSDVGHLLEARSRAEEGYRQFQAELKTLEHEVLGSESRATLDYDLSEEEWLRTLER